MAMTDQADKGVSDVRLRLPERAQVVWGASCVDDLLPAEHRARTVWAVVCQLDLSGFYEPIKAREGVAGRDTTDPRLLVSLWLYASLRGVGGAGIGAVVRREPAVPVAVRRREREPPPAGRLPHRPGRRPGRAVYRAIATLVKKGLVSVKRISQDGLRVRGAAGGGSFRRGSTLSKLQEEAAGHLRQLRELLDDPMRSAGCRRRRKAAKLRGARQRAERIDQAVALIPGLKAAAGTIGKAAEQKAARAAAA